MNTLSGCQPRVYPESFLDIGCGSGEITNEIARTLNGQHGCIKNAHGCDMFHVPTHPDNTSDYTYHQVVNNHIDLPDHSMDLVTCFMSIHHFDNFQQMMVEISRILKPTGLLFIREHDVPKSDGRLIQELNDLHTKFPDHSGPIHYWARNDLKTELIRLVFAHITDSEYPAHIRNKQRIYHSLWRKASV
jgi:ubiquinone/menaquinone biosynthesis C-methylase UbiE